MKSKPKRYSKKQLVECVGYIFNNIINERTRLERNMTLFENYVDEWIKQRK